MEVAQRHPARRLGGRLLSETRAASVSLAFDQRVLTIVIHVDGCEYAGKEYNRMHTNNASSWNMPMALDLEKDLQVEAHGDRQTRRLTENEIRQFDDMHWADADPQVNDQYRGEYVVPYMRRIVAHGHDLKQVLAEAAQATGRRPEELPVIAIADGFPDVTSF